MVKVLAMKVVKIYLEPAKGKKTNHNNHNSAPQGALDLGRYNPKEEIDWLTAAFCRDDGIQAGVTTAKTSVVGGPRHRCEDCWHVCLQLLCGRGATLRVNQTPGAFKSETGIASLRPGWRHPGTGKDAMEFGARHAYNSAA